METTTKSQFYGLSEDGKITLLPPSEYASAALKAQQQEMAAKGEPAPRYTMILNQHQYSSILSAVDAELEDLDGDTLIPTYFIIPFSTQLAVFAHASVDTDEEAAEFIQGYPVVSAGPFKLADVKASWPAATDAEVLEAETEADGDVIE